MTQSEFVRTSLTALAWLQQEGFEPTVHSDYLVAFQQGLLCVEAIFNPAESSVNIRVCRSCSEGRSCLSLTDLKIIEGMAESPIGKTWGREYDNSSDIDLQEKLNELSAELRQRKYILDSKAPLWRAAPDFLRSQSESFLQTPPWILAEHVARVGKFQRV